MRRLHDNGVMVNGSFVFGMDDDDIDVFDRTAPDQNLSNPDDRMPHDDVMNELVPRA